MHSRDLRVSHVIIPMKGNHYSVWIYRESAISTLGRQQYPLHTQWSSASSSSFAPPGFAQQQHQCAGWWCFYWLRWFADFPKSTKEWVKLPKWSIKCSPMFCFRTCYYYDNCSISASKSCPAPCSRISTHWRHWICRTTSCNVFPRIPWNRSSIPCA